MVKAIAYCEGQDQDSNNLRERVSTSGNIRVVQDDPKKENSTAKGVSQLLVWSKGDLHF